MRLSLEESSLYPNVDEPPFQAPKAMAPSLQQTPRTHPPRTIIR